MAWTSYPQAPTAISTGEMTVGQTRWNLLDESSEPEIEHSDHAAPECQRNDSFMDTKAVDSEQALHQQPEEHTLAAGEWTTVDEQRASDTDSSRIVEAWWTETKLIITPRPTWAYRSNAVMDPWWPSYFLPEYMICDLEESMPGLSWRDRAAGISALEGYSPAFYGEADDESHLE